jgi:uncharacterized damage-inducible protein DinB
MSIAQSLLPEYDQEMATTRRTLERVPEDKLSYKPDPKSMELGRLAGHIAEMVGWGAMTLQSDSIDIGTGDFKPLAASSRSQLLSAFDQNVKDTRAALEKASDADLMKPWSLLSKGATMMTMPKIAVVRVFMMNHIIHHRAQLGVYYRLNGVPVPSVYGPSADEQSFGQGA